MKQDLFHAFRAGRLPRADRSVTHQLGICSSGRLIEADCEDLQSVQALLGPCGNRTDALEPRI